MKNEIGKKALEHVVKEWNRVHKTNFIIEDACHGDVLLIQDEKRTYLHGSLLLSIGRVCETFGWSFGVFKDNDGHMYVQI